MKEDLNNLIKKHFYQIDNLLFDKNFLEITNVDLKNLTRYNYGIGTLISLKFLKKKIILRSFAQTDFILRVTWGITNILTFIRSVSI